MGGSPSIPAGKVSTPSQPSQPSLPSQQAESQSKSNSQQPPQPREPREPREAREPRAPPPSAVPTPVPKPHPHERCPSVAERSFLELLSAHGHDPKALESNPNVMYGLWGDLTLAFANAAYFQFAKSNGGDKITCTGEWSLNSAVCTAAGMNAGFFERNYKRAIRESRPWVHTYNCNSPAVFRSCQQIVYPLTPSLVTPAAAMAGGVATASDEKSAVPTNVGLLVVHSIRISCVNTPAEFAKYIEIPELPASSAALLASPNGSTALVSAGAAAAAAASTVGWVTQCSCCRRVRNQHSSEWEWIESVSRPGDVIHKNTTDSICDTCLTFFYGDDKRLNHPPKPFFTDEKQIANAAAAAAAATYGAAAAAGNNALPIQEAMSILIAPPSVALDSGQRIG